MTDELQRGSKLGKHGMAELAEAVITAPSRPPRLEPLQVSTPAFELTQFTERSLEPVPVHSFVSPRKRRTPGWMYFVGALIAVAALAMLAALMLVMARPALRGAPRALPSASHLVGEHARSRLTP